MRWVIIGEKIIGYFHVSEHIDHFKTNYFRFFHMTASLNKSVTSLKTLCNSEDKNAVHDTIADILKNMSALL